MSENYTTLTLLFLIMLLSFMAMPASANTTDSKNEWGFTAFSPEMKPETVKTVMKAVADWQIDNPSKRPTDCWTHGTLYIGMAVWSHMTEDAKYVQWLRKMGGINLWKLGEDPYLADDHCVGQMYLDLYERFKDEESDAAKEMIKATKRRLDWILDRPRDVSLKMQGRTPNGGWGFSHDRWCWADALFMAPPVWAQMGKITGEQKYLDFLDKEWWATTDYLYDTQEHLFYRDSRFFDKREKNGKKVFWGRGNGWVYGGLVRVLSFLPKDHPARDRYITLYREMSGKLLELQQSDGTWRSGLLDPETFTSPETSGSGFFCYGLAWGINNGILDRDTYYPVVEKAWAGLVKCVHPNGMLGYVQKVAGSPGKAAADSTEIYGVGAFLLAGSEIYTLSQK